MGKDEWFLISVLYSNAMVCGLFLCIDLEKYRAVYPKFNDMQPRFTLAYHGIEQLLERENKKVVIRMVPRYILVFITDVLPMFIRNIAIIKVEIFQEELLVLKWENGLSLLFWYQISCRAYS